MKTKFLLITVVISFFLCSCGSSGDFRTADSTEVTVANEDLSLAAELESREAAEQASREAEELASREAAEQASREAEELASKEAAEHASREAEELASREAAEQASREAEELASREAAEQASREAEELASREAAEHASREAAEQATESVVDVTESSTEAATRSYVLNTSTKKVHYPSCKDVDKIKSKNRKDVEANLEELTNQGYSPCGHCKPR